MIKWLALMGFVWATEAQAKCTADQKVFSSCQIEGRNTEVFVCFDDERATYQYGQIGGPLELILSETVESVEFEPWSGIGRETGESMTFYNGSYSYTLVGGFERVLPNDEDLEENGLYDAKTRHYGWLEVAFNDELLLRLECIPETISYAFGGGIYDLKVDSGQTWDDRARRWITGQN